MTADSLHHRDIVVWISSFRVRAAEHMRSRSWGVCQREPSCSSIQYRLRGGSSEVFFGRFVAVVSVSRNQVGPHPQPTNTLLKSHSAYVPTAIPSLSLPFLNR